MNIWQRTATALGGLGVPVAANRFIPASGNELPDKFLTFQLIGEPVELQADNTDQVVSHVLQISIWARSGLPELVASARSALKAAGYQRSGSQEMDYQPETRHFGLAMDYSYLEDV